MGLVVAAAPALGVRAHAGDQRLHLQLEAPQMHHAIRLPGDAHARLVALLLGVVRIQQLLRRQHDRHDILQVRRRRLMRILVDPRLHDGHRQRGVAPGQELAAIHGDGGDAAQAFRPGPRLFVVGEARREGQRRRSLARNWLERAPAVILGGGTRAAGVFYRREHSLQRRCCRIALAQRAKRGAIRLDLAAKARRVAREGVALAFEFGEQLLRVEHARLPSAASACARRTASTRLSRDPPRRAARP